MFDEAGEDWGDVKPTVILRDGKGRRTVGLVVHNEGEGEILRRPVPGREGCEVIEIEPPSERDDSAWDPMLDRLVRDLSQGFFDGRAGCSRRGAEMST